MIATAPLVYVRTASGTVKLNEGDAVPDNANQEHVAQLADKGLLGEAAAPKPPKPPKSPEA